MNPPRRSLFSRLARLLILAVAGLSCGPARDATPPVVKAEPAPPKVAAPAAAPPSKLTTAEIVERCEPSVALIVGHDGSGTGFLVAPGLVATNAHVIEDENAEDLEVRFPSAADGKRGPFKATLVTEDPGRDLAFLKVATDLPALEVARSYRFRKGEDVTIIGNPGIGPKQVLENAISRGVLSTKTSLDGQPFYQLNAAVNPGNSGGPVFDATGTVIGVVTLKAARGEQLTFCIPVEDLVRGIEQAKGVAALDADPGATSGPVPTIAYDWKEGETYVYSIHATLDDAKVARRFDGSSIYTVRARTADRIELAQRGWLTTRRTERDGGTPAGGAVSMPSAPATTRLDVDRRGNLLGDAGKAPSSLLGDLAAILFVPLPDPPKRSWEVVRDATLTHLDSGPGDPGFGFGFGSRFPIERRPSLGRGRMFPFGGFPVEPAEASLPLHETTRYVASAAPGGLVRVSRSMKQRLGARGDGQPLLTISSTGVVTFDPKRGVPITVETHGRLSAGNYRAPFRVTCRLAADADRARLMAFPSLPTTARQPITPEELDRHLAALRGSAEGPWRDAARALAEAEPIEARRAEVARALEARLDESRDGLNRAVATALGVWGDAASRPLLIDRLKDVGYGARREVVDALARLGPDRAAAEAIVACLGTSGLDAARAVRALGASAEPALRAIVRGDGPLSARVEACRLLGEVGTAASLPDLKPLAARKEGAQLAKQAGETLAAIRARFPDDGELGRLLNDLESDMPKTRQEALTRLAQLPPEAGRRDEVVHALTPMLADPDAETQAGALRALGGWGPEAARLTLLARIGDPKFIPWREAVTLLTTRGPSDEALARAVADRLDADRAGVFEALKALGPAAEAPALVLLDHRDSGIRRGACGVLAAVGGERSIKPLEARAGDGSDPFLGGATRQALDAVKARRAADESIRALLPRLRAKDLARRDEAIRRVLATPPSGALRAEVARALEEGLDPRAPNGQEELYKALGTLGDGATRAKLLPLVADRTNHRWRQVVEALVALGLDDEALRALAGRLPDDPSFLAIVLRKAGPGAEPILRERLRDDADPAVRLDACRLLATVGTPESYPVLENLASVSTDLEPLAAAAADAVRAIAARP